MSTAIDISKLTPIERQELKSQFAKEEKQRQQKIKETKATYKELAEEFVNAHIGKLVSHKEITDFLIKQTMADFEAVKELKNEVYGVKNQDSYTSTLKDGSASITVGQNVVIRFDGTESAGIEKIKDYMKSLASESDNAKKLGKIVDKKLKTNHKTGFLNPSSIIDLNSLREEFNSDLFSEGLDIIINAQIRTVNSTYISGWKYIQGDNETSKKLEFRFTL